MKHDWRESYNADMTSVIFKCRHCNASMAVRKEDCHFHSPDEDEELLERRGISLNCNDQQVRKVMES